MNIIYRAADLALRLVLGNAAILLTGYLALSVIAYLRSVP